MAERVSASIIIGGRLPAELYGRFVEPIKNEQLSIEWDGDPFEPSDRAEGHALRLYAHEVAYGRFEALETWCITQGLPFARWSGGYPGQWDGQRCVFAGEGEPVPYATDEGDYVVIGREKAIALGSLDGILSYFDAANFPIPALVVVDLGGKDA